MVRQDSIMPCIVHGSSYRKRVSPSSHFSVHGLPLSFLQRYYWLVFAVSHSIKSKIHQFEHPKPFTSIMSTNVSKSVWDGRIPLKLELEEAEAIHFGADKAPAPIYVRFPLDFGWHSPFIV
jgi:hypothetical protein